MKIAWFSLPGILRALILRIAGSGVQDDAAR